MNTTSQSVSASNERADIVSVVFDALYKLEKGDFKFLAEETIKELRTIPQTATYLLHALRKKRGFLLDMYLDEFSSLQVGNTEEHQKLKPFAQHLDGLIYLLAEDLLVTK